MKRLFWTLFLVCLSALCSCSRKQEIYTIGVSQCSVDEWRAVANNEMMQEASFYGDLSVEIKSVRDDSRQQIEDIEYFIAEGVDLLIISPNESAMLTPVVEKA